MQYTIKNIRTSMVCALDARGERLYDDREIRSITDLLLQEVLGLSRTDRILHPDLCLSNEQHCQIDQIAQLLSRGVPVQQALGYEWFMDRKFMVTPDVLIPRPETAELVSWVVSSCAQGSGAKTDDKTAEDTFSVSGKPLNILDVGTGSGCIALSLARLINNSQVTALDLSTAALDVARQNACQQGVDNVQLVQDNILAIVDNLCTNLGYPDLSTGIEQGCQRDNQHGLSTTYPHLCEVCPPSFNIIVSNPPYICRCEAAEMSDLVLKHEPGMALFVPDHDPLLFYRAIARFALTKLTEDGLLFFEINAAYGPETCAMLRDLGFCDIELRQDVTGRDRMVRAAVPHR